jgi:hypothetical protein
MRRELGKACVLGLLGGTLTSLWAHERILGPLRPPGPIRHTEANCLFERRAWFAEAGQIHTRGMPQERSARSRMGQDIADHHLRKGLTRSRVQALLGWPDVVEKGDTWIYALTSGTDLIVTFNLWGAVAGISSRISCHLGSPTRAELRQQALAPTIVPPNKELQRTRPAQAMEPRR